MKQNYLVIIISLISAAVVFAGVFVFLNNDNLLGDNKTKKKETTLSQELETEQKDLFMALQDIHQFVITSTDVDIENPRQLAGKEETEFISSLKGDIDSYASLEAKLSQQLSETSPLFDEYSEGIGDKKNDDQVYADVLLLVNSSGSTLENSQKEIENLNELIRLREEVAPTDPSAFLAESKSILDNMRTVEVSLFTSSFLDKFFGSYPENLDKTLFLSLTQV